MPTRIDISDIDSAFSDWEKECWDSVAQAGRDAVQYAKENGEYKNHTGNLRSAPGFAVVRDGEIIQMEVPDNGHPEAKEKTENFIIYGKKPENGLILADGMEYASFVESKGFDVLSGAALKANKLLNK